MKHLADELFALAACGLPDWAIELGLLRYGRQLELLVIFAAERQSRVDHLVENDAEAPHIRFEIAGLRQKTFRRQVSARASLRDDALVWLNLASEAEVGDLDPDARA